MNIEESLACCSTPGEVNSIMEARGLIFAPRDPPKEMLNAAEVHIEYHYPARVVWQSMVAWLDAQP